MSLPIVSRVRARWWLAGVVLLAMWGPEANAQVNTLMARTTADRSTTSTSFVNVPDLSWYVAANASYAFECRIAYTTTTFFGIPEMFLSVNGPASPTAVQFSVFEGITSTTLQAWTGNAYDTPTSPHNGGGAGTTAQPVVMRGTFENGATGGTLSLRFLTTNVFLASVTILRGSFCIVARQ